MLKPLIIIPLCSLGFLKSGNWYCNNRTLLFPTLAPPKQKKVEKKEKKEYEDTLTLLGTLHVLYVLYILKYLGIGSTCIRELVPTLLTLFFLSYNIGTCIHALSGFFTPYSCGMLTNSG